MDTVYARSVVFLPRKAANREKKQPRANNIVVINKDEKSWTLEDHFDIRHGDRV